MASEQRRALYQLVGTDESLSLDDPSICRPYCVDFCVYDELSGTKAARGRCPRIHNERLRMDYRSGAPRPEFCAEFLAQLKRLVSECDRLIKSGVGTTGGTSSMASAHPGVEVEASPQSGLSELTKMLLELNTELGLASDELQALGRAGKTSLAMAEYKRRCEVEKNRHVLIQKLRQQLFSKAFEGHQKLQLCPTCGSHLSSEDTDKRLADHIVGRMHRAYHRCREALVTNK